jgi:hypothetical protein
MNRVLVLLGVSIWMLSLTSEPFQSKIQDAMLGKLEMAIPDGWNWSLNSDTLKIEHPDQMWVLKSNFINAPAEAYENSEANRIKIMEHGSKTKAHFYFLLKPKKGLPKTELSKANYFSQKYALFQITADGFDTPYARYYPFIIEEEATRLYNVILRENLKVGVGPVYPEVDYSRP